MPRIIKSYKTEEERILEYVRSPQESLNADAAGGSHYADPSAILAEARAQAEIKVQEAYAEGLRRGEEAGLKQFGETVGNAAEMLDQLAVSLEEHRGQFVSELENYVVELTRLVASKVLGRELSTTPEIIHDMVQRSLERLSMEERVSIRVSPEDYQQVLAVKPELESSFARITHLEIISDEGIETGGCIAESDALHVNADLSSQLNEIIEGLHEIHPEGEDDD